MIISGGNPVMKRYIKSGVSPWKTKYTVHWISPDGKDCLLGGSNSVDEANEIAQRQAREIFESPFESNERKFHFLETIYIVDMQTEEDVMNIDTDDYIDSLMSELHSRPN